MIIYNVHARIGRESALYLEVWVIFPYLCTRKRNERPSGDAGSLALRDL